MYKIHLEFGSLLLTGRLFNTNAGQTIAGLLPVEVALTTWGDECYGPLTTGLVCEDLVSFVPPGGIAFTDRGNYLCIFYGQQPAWPVELVGNVDGWDKLKSISPLKVRISLGFDQSN